MTMELRVLRPADWDHWYGMLELAFGGVPESPEERALWREVTCYDRSIGVWDDGEVVGTTGAFSFRITVPGGASVPAAGVTMVGVRPTHRRRGVLRSMMRRQLDDVRSWGEPLAVLTASEPGIYGRFGYGAATYRMTARIDTTHARLSVPQVAENSHATYATDGVRLRLSEPGTARAACEEVYAQAVTTRPGMLARRPGWDAVPVVDPESAREGASPLQCVLAEADGRTVGYARYAVRPAWDLSGPRGTVVLRDLEALTPAARTALWQYLFGIDLTSVVEAGSLPVDDPLLQMVNDIRRCEVRVTDHLHVRLVDVGAALAARTYQVPVDVVLDVTDDFCPWNSGRWRLTGDAKGASCERTRDAADLALSVRELGAAYLGGTPLTALAAAGRVAELSEGALAEAASAFGGTVAPWLPHGF
ncbi:GNAT family N-acetyltransferase [Streptomyces sp. SCA3-4]|uniref:GNAT family N-acetyltransferase n=1 Tax=Streptomyces sichuanensis TaxID=2871810 RepID=UPI001CE3A9C5|nr:GNAT family N-acetyltransferase [Streptomyces sichuanensis]MCA6095445.1 GNAT family N-acetyltransferase [Streptomyces sichuanensis]